MENPEDDPREFAHGHHDDDNLDDMQGLGMHPNFLCTPLFQARSCNITNSSFMRQSGFNLY